MNDLPLLNVRGHAPPGDPLGRVYTPQPLADAIARYLTRFIREPPRSIVEPSVGGGAFVRAVRGVWPGVEVSGVDIDPGAPGLQLVDRPVLGDWTSDHPGGWEWEIDDLGIGNPPFGKKVKMAVTCAHVVASVRRSFLTALILPTPTLGSVMFNERVLSRYPLHAYVQLLPRPWDRVRECGLFVWWTIRDTTGRQVIKRIAGPPVLDPPIRWR